MWIRISSCRKKHIAHKIMWNLLCHIHPIVFTQFNLQLSYIFTLQVILPNCELEKKSQIKYFYMIKIRSEITYSHNLHLFRCETKEIKDCTSNHWKSDSLHVISTFSHTFNCDCLFSTWENNIQSNFNVNWTFPHETFTFFVCIL